jgi:methionyl-tRNA synthetase
VSVVVNLKPIKLKGTLSEGMILMTEDAEGKLTFLNPDNDSSVNNGTSIN